MYYMLVFFDVISEQLDTYNRWNDFTNEEVFNQFKHLKSLPEQYEDVFLVEVKEFYNLTA